MGQQKVIFSVHEIKFLLVSYYSNHTFVFFESYKVICCGSYQIEVTLRLTVNQSVCLGIEHLCGTCDQILLPIGMLLSEIYGLVYVGRPL
jgi:hypothetical protein